MFGELMTGARGVCIYVRMYVCIMCKDEGRIRDEWEAQLFFSCVFLGMYP